MINLLSKNLLHLVSAQVWTITHINGGPAQAANESLRMNSKQMTGNNPKSQYFMGLNKLLLTLDGQPFPIFRKEITTWFKMCELLLCIKYREDSVTENPIFQFSDWRRGKWNVSPCEVCLQAL